MNRNAQLQPNSHSPRELTSRALAYFDKDHEQWSNLQWEGSDGVAAKYEKLQEILSTQDYTAVAPEFMMELIADIGKVFFFMDQENDVVVEWRDTTDPWPHVSDALAVATITTTGQAKILFNLRHSYWRSLPPAQRATKVMATLLHEWVHVPFLLFATDKFGRERHHAGWQVPAKAVERHAPAILGGLQPDLGRRRCLILDHYNHNWTDLTQEELHECFDDYFVYHQRTNFMTTPATEPLSGLTEEQRGIYQPNTPEGLKAYGRAGVITEENHHHLSLDDDEWLLLT